MDSTELPDLPSGQVRMEHVHLVASKHVWRLVIVLLSFIIGLGGWRVQAIEHENAETRAHADKEISAIRADLASMARTHADDSTRLGRFEERLGGVERGVERIERSVSGVADKIDRFLERGHQP